MYCVTYAALMAAPWLILASVPTAEATDINACGDLNCGPPAPNNDTSTGFHIGGGIGLAASQADLSTEGYRAANLISWCYARPRPSDRYTLSKTTETLTKQELVLLGSDSKAVARLSGWKWRAV
jgi:hypothetical protein